MVKIARSTEQFIGPFIVGDDDTQEIWVTIVAPQGLYKDNGSSQFRTDVEYELRATPVDKNENEIGPFVSITSTVFGSSSTRDQRGDTLRLTGLSGRQKIQVRRITDTDLSFNGNVVDEIKIAALLAVHEVESQHFGDVTTVHSKTYATTGALSLKQRKLNCVATRKIPRRDGDGFTETLHATKDASDIFCALALDPKIGRRGVAELDLDSVYDAVQSQRDYYGQDSVGEFSYTFDDSDMTFEQMAFVVADAVGCSAYRRGRKIGLRAERANRDASLVFNHRNTVPGSQLRTINFGNVDDHDGVNLDYVDPKDGSTVTLYMPENQSAQQPKTVETIGVRSKILGWYALQREWAKVKYSNITTEFTALEEAALTLRGDLVLVADNTRPDTMDGDVEDQSMFVLTLSQDVMFEDDYQYMIFLQITDGTSDNIPVVAGFASNEVILERLPRASLSVGSDKVVSATYIIHKVVDAERSLFIVTDKDPEEQHFKITAVNYDARYYLFDGLTLWFKGERLEDSGPLDRILTLNSGAFINDVYVSDSIGGGVSVAGDALITDRYTISLWIKPDQVNVDALIFGSRVSGAVKLVLDNGILSAGHNLAGDTVSVELIGNDWQHVDVTYADGFMALYVGGVRVDSANNVPLHQGQELTGFDGFVGETRDLRFYSRALASNEIAALAK